MQTYQQSLNAIVRRQIRKLAAQIESKEIVELGDWVPKWSVVTKAKVGAALLQMLIDTAHLQAPRYEKDAHGKNVLRFAIFTHREENADRIDIFSGYERVPAFFSSYAYINSKRVGVVRFHPALTEKLENASDVKEVGLCAFFCGEPDVHVW